MKSYQRGAPRRGNEHPAQGNALGTNGQSNFRPEGAKALQHMAAACMFPSEWNAFALSGRGMMCARINPGRCPGLVAFCPFRALIAVWNRFLTSET